MTPSSSQSGQLLDPVPASAQALDVAVESAAVPSRSWGGAATGLFVLGCLYTVYFAQVFLVPVVVASLVALILAPVVRWLMKLRLPRTAASGLVCLILVATVSIGVHSLANPAVEMVEKAPQTLHKVKSRLGSFSGGPLEKVSEVTDSVSQITSPGRRLKVQTTTLQEELLSQLTTFASSLVIILILIFFMLATGKDLLRKLVVMTSLFSSKKRVVAIVQQLSSDVSRYLITITGINLLLGCTVAGAMYVTGMPTPALWGSMAFLFNFIPYLGALVGVGILATVSLVTFPTLGGALLPPALYLGLTTFEGMVVTPSILGRRLPVGPLALILGLLFWGWMWGIVGAFVAVPLMAATKIVCDRFPSSQWLGALLGSQQGAEEQL